MTATTTVTIDVDGRTVEVPSGGSLLDALRDHADVRSAKDGCAPQGQCGCCTVWVDGQPRVACVTPVARVAGRAITTIDHLPDAEHWAQRFAEAGASQCGFCTPGIIMRLAALADPTPQAVRQALLAHLCRCTGWQTIVEATTTPVTLPSPARTGLADDGNLRAEVEGRAAQEVGPAVAMGRGGFSVDTAPPGSLVAMPDEHGQWVVADTMAEARRLARRVQGRRSTLPISWPVPVPDGDWDLTLQTTWVEPAYLEPDAAWCHPGGEPSSPAANGGAFGGKTQSPVGAVARRLADQYDRTVLAVLTRDDVVRTGPKRPPLAIGIRADGTGVAQVVRTPGVAAAITAVAPGLRVFEVDVPGPPTSAAIRAAGWAEAAVALAAVTGATTIHSPDGAQASATIDDDGTVHVSVRCGSPLEPTVLRSYCIGAAHMALGWVRSEAIVVDDSGRPVDVTVRSAGILRAVDTPHLEVHLEPDDGPPVNGSDAVFAAVALAAWRRAGLAPRWPTMRS